MTNIYGYSSKEYFSSISIGTPLYTLPDSDGDDGYQLQTDGKGTVSWQPAQSGSGDFKSLICSGTTTLTGAVTCSSTLSITNGATASNFRASSAGSLSVVQYQCQASNSGFYLSAGTQFIFVLAGSSLIAFDSAGLYCAIATMNLGQSGLPWNNLYCNRIIQPATGSMTAGAISSTSISSTGTNTFGSNTLATTTTTILGAGSTTDCGSIALFGNNASTTAANLYGITVQKSGVDSIKMGINKNSTTGQIPASALYITSGLTNSIITIGRGNGSGLPSVADISISSTGGVAMTTGQVAIASTSYSSTSLVVYGSGSITDGGLLATFQNGGVANLGGIRIGNGTNFLMLGTNKNSITNQVPAGASYLSTTSDSDKLAIGRGNNVSIPFFADILLNGDGSVSMTNGLLSASSIAVAGTFTCGTNAATVGSLTTTSVTTTNYELDGYQTTLQSITSGSNIAAYLDTLNYNTNFTFTPSTSATSIIAPVNGFYGISATVIYPANAVGTRYMFINFNGVRKADDYRANAGASDQVAIACYAQGRLTAGQSIQVLLRQNSGSSLTVSFYAVAKLISL